VRETRRRATMMRRRFWGALIGAIVLFFIVFSLFPADGRASDSTDEDIEAAIIAGTDAGNAVVEAKANSMERERAVFDIRARESQLRKAGFPSAADAYADAAEKGMKEAGLFE